MAVSGAGVLLALSAMFWQKRIRIIAACARVALPFGTSVLLPVPEIYDVKTVKEGDTVSKPTNPSRSGYSNHPYLLIIPTPPLFLLELPGEIPVQCSLSISHKGQNSLAI